MPGNLGRYSLPAIYRWLEARLEAKRSKRSAAAAACQNGNGNGNDIKHYKAAILRLRLLREEAASVPLDVKLAHLDEFFKVITAELRELAPELARDIGGLSEPERFEKMEAAFAELLTSLSERGQEPEE